METAVDVLTVIAPPAAILICRLRGRAIGLPHFVVSMALYCSFFLFIPAVLHAYWLLTIREEGWFMWFEARLGRAMAAFPPLRGIGVYFERAPLQLADFWSSLEGRELTDDEVAVVAKQSRAPAHKVFLLNRDARVSWDRFYRRNMDNFFKDRKWPAVLLRFGCGDRADFNTQLTFFEAGSGVGNKLFPIAGLFPHWRFQAVDFSANAVRLLRRRAQALGIAVETTELDLSIERREVDGALFPSGSADLATLVFVVSAIHPDKHDIVARNLARLVKVGGTLLVRDYGANDAAMLRFGREAKLGDRFYARADGTRVYYFTLGELTSPFEGAGFRVVRREFLHRRTINHEKGVDVPRVIVQAVLVREAS